MSVLAWPKCYYLEPQLASWLMGKPLRIPPLNKECNKCAFCPLPILDNWPSLQFKYARRTQGM